MLFLDGIYADNKHGTSRFRWVKAPTSAELTQLTHTIAHRVGRYLERQSLLAPRAGNVAGFSLHAGVTARAHERAKLERLCRYIARPAVSTQRLSLTRNGQVRYELNQK